MFKAICWKEWREQRWLLAFGCMLLMGFTAISLHSRIFQDAFIFIFVLPVGGCFLPLLAAIGMVSAEREARVLPFMQGLPFPPGRLLAIKFWFALLTVWLPPLGAWLVCWFFLHGEAFSREFIIFFMITLWLAFSFLVWTLAFSMRQPTEARTGLVGLLVLGFWFFHLVTAISLGKNPAGHLLGAFNPIYLFQYLDVSHDRAGRLAASVPLLFQSVVLVLLWFWATRRFRKAGGVRA